MKRNALRAAAAYGLTCMLGLLCATSIADAQLLTSIGDPVHGERLFRQKHCSRCHGGGGDGSRVAPSVQRTALKRKPIELAGIIWNHSPEMTAKARELDIARPVLSGAETGDILAYLYSLSFSDAEGNAARGLVVLKEKRCLTCHTSARTGAPTDAPTLRDLSRFGSSVAMLEAMWRHAADMQDEMRAQQLRRVTFAADDMSHIITYLGTLASPSKASGQLKGDAREGATLFTVKGCSRCHAVYGFGGRVAPDLGTRSLPRTPSAIAGVIWNHGSRMRMVMERYGVPQPEFSSGELMNLVAYLYFLGFADPAGDVTRGRALFGSRGCARCHGTGTDARTRMGPDLSRSQAVLSSLEAARLMLEHAPKMEPKLKEMGLRWPEFEHTEMADLLAYITSLPAGKSN